MRNLARSIIVSVITVPTIALLSSPASAKDFYLKIDAPNGAYGVAQWFDGSESLCIFAGAGPINGDWARVTITPVDGVGPRFSVKATRGTGRRCLRGLAAPENERYRMKIVAYDVDGDDWWKKRAEFTT